MNNYREYINRLFERFGEFVIKFRRASIILTLALIGPLLIFLPDLRINSSLEASFHTNDKTLQDYQKFRDKYGRGDSIVIMV